MTVATSYSRIKKFRQCQMKSWWMDYAPKHMKVKEPPNEIFEKGKQWHTNMERAILGQNGLPPQQESLQRIVEALKRMPEKYVEKQMAFREDLTQTSWFGDDVWMRVIWDFGGKDGNILHLIDWKTGRPRPDDDQLELFAASGFRMFPDVDEVHTYFVFMEHNRYTHDTFYRSAETHIWQKFGEEAEQIKLAMETGNWEPNPGNHCRYCPVPKSKCQYSQVDA